MDAIKGALRAGGGIFVTVVSVLGATNRSLSPEQASRRVACKSALENGERLVVERRLQEAQQVLVEAAANCPTVPEMFNALGVAYDSDGRYDKAQAAFEQAVRLNPGSAGFHNNLAASFIRSGKEASGIAEFERALGLDASNATARLNLASIYLRRKHFKRALGYLDIAEIRQSRDPLVQLGLTEAYFGAGQTQAGRETAARLERLPGVDSKVHFSLGLVLAQHGEYQLAAGQFEAIPAADRDVAAAMNLGMAYTRLKSFERARAAYEEALQLDPKNPDPYFDIGADESAMGNHQAAVDWMTEAHNQVPNRPDISFALAEELIRSRNYERANSLLTLGLANQPNDPNLREALGDLFAAQDQRQDAVKAYEACLRLNRRRLSARLSLARVCEDMGQTEKARAALAEVLKLDAKNAEAEAQLGRLAFEAGNEKEASSFIESALTHDPNNLLANQYRAQLQIRNGQLTGARQTLERLVQLDPQSSRFHLLLGRVLARLNQSAEAEREFALSKELELKHGDPEER
jgi:Flp pilus assembly protein TadD